MGKAQKKTGKGRLDKYYKLAKEQGYRARSAFKLIQLNKKYAFLESARCCIDLCAAPGGWLQVASKYMPANSVIVGVDLVSIKPIPHVVTFTADITTPQCHNLIRSELKDWKADVVLHDGAPNVGTAWIQDAYSQSELVLMSLKLAVQFLIKGGTFVTKVFRSVDYNNLLWVFNQLFGKVEATKPPSSRNVSAEIFVVCRNFLAPKHIDPKFLDPRHVFKDLGAITPSGTDKGSSANNVQANVFHPDKKRRKRDGYDEGDYILFKAAPSTEFIKASDPISLLGTVNKIIFETEEEKEWLALDITTSDVKANCEDLKVLSKGDFKTLLKWRLALREELGLDVKTKQAEELTEVVEVIEEVDEEQQIQEELERLNAEAAARAKRERRRANEVKTKTIQRMQLQMTAPLDIGLEQHDASLGFGQDDFSALEGAKKVSRRTMLSANAYEAESEEDIENADDGDSDAGEEWKLAGLEAELDGLYDAYQQRRRERDAKFRVKEAREKWDDWDGVKAKESGSEDEDEGDADSEGGWDVMQEAKERAGEDSSSDETDIDEERDPNPSGQKRKRTRNVEHSSKITKRVRLGQNPKNSEAPINGAAKVWFSQDVFADMNGLEFAQELREDTNEEEVVPEEEADEDGDQDDWEDDNISTSEKSDGFETVPRDADGDTVMWNTEGDSPHDARKVQKNMLVTPEAVTLAQQLVNREKTKTQLINDGFNRYSLNSKDGLPSWFLDDESKYYKPNIPITKEAVAALRAKQRDLDARPIKKIAEAKARKKYKAAQRLEKAMKKAEGVNATSDMSEREKAQQIEKLMRRGMSKGKKEKKDIKVVVAKGSHKGLKGRPKGVKGRYRMVDSRMKKEMRATKRKEKSKKKRRA